MVCLFYYTKLTSLRIWHFIIFCFSRIFLCDEGDQPWDFFGRNDAKAVLWPPHGRVDSLEKTLMLGGIGAGGEGDDRGWDGWMASPTWYTWVWVNSGSWWWTGRPGVLWFMGSQRAGHDWATDLNLNQCPHPSIGYYHFKARSSWGSFFPSNLKSSLAASDIGF